MTVGRFIDSVCALHAHRPALVADETTLTYGELLREVNRLAHGLLGLGLAPGEHVGVLLPNSAAWMITDLALMKAGLAHVRLHTKLTASEFEYLINDAACAAVICDAELGEPLLDERARFPTVRSWIVNTAERGDLDGSSRRRHQGAVVDFDQLVTGADSSSGLPAVGGETIANIRYTAGTTGRPKGAVFTHTNRIAGISRFLTEAAFTERGPQPGLGLPRRTLSIAPLTHAAATHYYFTFAAGGVNIIPRRAQWDPEWTARYMAEQQVTHMFLVPTMIYDLFSHAPDVAVGSRIPIETIVYGASVMPAELLAESRERFGEVMVQLFGMTEVDGAFAILHKTDHRVAPTSVGRPFVTSGFEVVGPDGAVLPAGESGEILGWGPQMMREYLNQPEATAKTIVDGKMHTGDIGHIDEQGYLYYEERIDDMIVSGGLNVYPREVEDVLNNIPGIRESALVSRPHPRWGQEVVAAVVVDPSFDRDVTGRELADRLAAYKRPKAIIEVEELPRSQTGKLLRRRVRELVASLADGAR